MARTKLRARVDYNQRKQAAQQQIARQRRPVRPPGAGVKDIEERRVRNRRFKIKRIIDQPKKTEVKKNGRVVHKMVLRRRTIYPGMVRRNYY